MVPAFFVFLPFVIFLLIAGCQAQLTSSCSEIPTTPNFDANKILGRWYRYISYNENPVGRCGQMVIKTDAGDITTMTRIKILNTPSERIEKKGITKYIGDASFYVTSPKDNPYYNHTLKFWSTDYTSYAIEGSCYNDNRARVQYYWIMTREKFPSGSVIAQINKAMTDEGLKHLDSWPDNQNNCPSDL